MAQRISGKNFDIRLGDLAMNINKATLSIEDGTEVALDNGVPNGWVAGDTKASGELELDAQAVSLVMEAAKAAGSFRELETFDMLFYAKTGSEEEMKVEAFGCKLSIDSLLDVDKKGGEKHLTKVKYVVTSPDFVRINGVPYLSAEETEGLVRSDDDEGADGTKNTQANG
ncbi:MAG: DUF2597 family protein [Proteobacteria bacterium]|nr:DUF2597 family protein [Pseudomonadota bacterium]